MNFKKKAQVKRVSDNISFGKYKLNVNQMHRNAEWKERWEKFVYFAWEHSEKKKSVATLLNNETTKRFIPEKFYDNPYFNAFLIFNSEKEIILKVQNPRTLETETVTIKDSYVFEDESTVKEKYYFAFDFVFADESKVGKFMGIIKTYIRTSNLVIGGEVLECIYIDYVKSSDMFTIRVDTNIEVPSSPKQANKIENGTEKGTIPYVLRDIYSVVTSAPGYNPVEISNIDFSPSTKPGADFSGAPSSGMAPSTIPPSTIPKTIDVDDEEISPLSIRGPYLKQPTAQPSLNRIIKLANKFSTYLK